MKSSSLQRSLAYRGKMYAAQAGLTAKFGNYTPSTDGKTVFFPRLPLGEVEPDTAALFDRWVIHEALGHGRYTDFSCMKKEEAAFRADPRLHGIWNAIEDPRIEKCGIAFLPGTALGLRKGLEVSVRQGRIKDPKGSPAQALQMYILHWGRLFMLGHTEVQQHYKEAAEETKRLLGDAGFLRMEALISSEFERLSSTADAVALAKRVLALVEEIAEEQENNPEPESDPDAEPESSDEDEGEGSEGEDESDGEPSPEGNSSGGEEEEGDEPSSGGAGDGDEDESEGDEEQSSGAQGSEGSESDPGDEEGESQDKPTSGARQILESEPESADPDETVEALMQALQEEIKKAEGSASSYDDGSSNVIHESGADPVEAYESADRYDEMRAETSAVVATLRQQLVSLLQAQARRHKVTGSRGRIAGRLLHRAVIGNDNYRRKRHEELLPTSAVSLLVDLSGSMGYQKAALAQQSLIAVAEACHAVGVPLEIYGFGGENANAGGLVEIKPFNQGFHQAKAKLGGYTANAGGLTPMGEAMMEAGYRLVSQPAPRHTMMVITDGYPNNGEYTRNVIAMLESGGVQTLGIGIMTDAVKGLFSRYSVVNDVESLGRDVFSLLRGAILDAA